MSGVIDSHVHVDPVRFTPIETLARAMRVAGVDQAVLIQNIGGDNDYLADVVRADPGRFAAVMWLDPKSVDQETELEMRSLSGLFRGVRLFAETLETTPGTWRRAAELGLIIVVSFLTTGLRETIGRLERFTDAHPDAQVVVTRYGLAVNEPLANRPLDLLGTLARNPATIVEVSTFPDRATGLAGAGAADAARDALGLFGPERTVFGSGFPARDRNGTMPNAEELYRRDLATVFAGDLGVPTEALPGVLGNTPSRLWFPSKPLTPAKLSSHS